MNWCLTFFFYIFHELPFSRIWRDFQRDKGQTTTTDLICECQYSREKNIQEKVQTLMWMFVVDIDDRVWREFLRFCLSFLGRHDLFLEVLENKIFLLNVIKVFTFFVIFSVPSNRGVDQSWLLSLSKDSQISSLNRDIKFWLNHCELILAGALLIYLVTIISILKSLLFLVCWIRFTPALDKNHVDNSTQKI